MLFKYIQFIKKIIKTKTDAIPEEKNFSDEVVRLLKIDNIKMWSRLWNVFHVLEDTEEAKQNYEKFGIKGPTKYEDIGEKYLRLYGVLNSIWLQKNAIVELFSIFKCNGKKKLNSKFKSFAIIDLRNIAGSHTTNFCFDNKKTTSYSIARFTIDEDEILCVDENTNSKEIHLKKSIEEYNSYTITVLQQIAEKMINTIYKNETKMQTELKKELGYLNEEAKGNIVINIEDETIIFKIIGV